MNLGEMFRNKRRPCCDWASTNTTEALSFSSDLEAPRLETENLLQVDLDQTMRAGTRINVSLRRTTVRN